MQVAGQKEASCFLKPNQGPSQGVGLVWCAVIMLGINGSRDGPAVVKERSPRTDRAHADDDGYYVDIAVWPVAVWLWGSS